MSNFQLSFILAVHQLKVGQWISSSVLNQQFNVRLSAAFHLSCPPAESWTVNQQQRIESAIQCPTFSCPPAVNLCHHFHRISVQLSLFVRELMVGNCWKCWSTCHQLCHSHCTLINTSKSVQNAKSNVTNKYNAEATNDKQIRLYISVCNYTCFCNRM